ncbi:hypothetical protein EVAR_54334_1 [Eumeta japonica]|uniref:Uncharacterized protein n=1 Tax=Eumeta variegata TaxID=151549 RepID=A0A4C1Y5P8_EUMVA|nr:hypothetical protein EVAR_54334_1 [Eumeta japonica]
MLRKRPRPRRYNVKTLIIIDLIISGARSKSGGASDSAAASIFNRGLLLSYLIIRVSACTAPAGGWCGPFLGYDLAKHTCEPELSPAHRFRPYALTSVSRESFGRRRTLRLIVES